MPDTTTNIPDRITFTKWLTDFNGGALDDELSAAVDEVAAAVLLQEKAGTIKLTLSFTADGGGIVVAADVKAEPPRPKRSAFFYHDSNRHGLSRRDPRQPQLPGTEDRD